MTTTAHTPQIWDGAAAVLPVPAVAERLGTDPDAGLTTAEAACRLATPSGGYAAGPGLASGAAVLSRG